MLAYFIRMHLITLFISLVGIYVPKETYGLTWEEPALEFVASPNGSGIDLAADPYGNAFTAYTTFDNDLDSGSVEVTLFSNEAQLYAPPVTLVSGQSYSNLSVGKSAINTGLCVWLNSDLSNAEYSYYNGTTWSTPVNLATDVFEPNATMNNLGNGLAAWVPTTTLDLYISFFNGGTQTWGTPQLIPGSSDAFFPLVAFNNAGNAIVVWSDSSSQVLASVYNVGLNVWSSPTIFGTDLFDYSVGMDVAGNAVVAWRDFNSTNIFAAYYNGSWGTSVNVSSGDDFRYSLAMNPAGGAAVLAWVDNTNVASYSQLIAGTWTAPSVFATGASYLAIALDSVGNTLFTWNNPTLNRTFGIYKPFGGPLGAIDPITEASEPLLAPSVAALSDNGRGFVDGFIDPSEGNSSLGGNFTLLEVLGKACIDPNTGSRVRVLAWSPFNDAGLVAYYLKRNGVLMAVNLATDPRIYYDWDRNIDIEDTYSISGVDEFGNELSQRVIVLQ